MFWRRVLALSCVLAAQAAQAPVARQPAPGAGVDELFDDTILHDIRLGMRSHDWATLRRNFRQNTYYPADFTWRGTTIRNVGIRSRGSGSRHGTKPGLRVDFDRHASGQTFHGLRSLVLDNLTQDASMLKERLSMAFFRRMGLPAPREAHARVFVNDQYAGLYAVVEPIDSVFLARALGESGRGGMPAGGYLFEYNWVPEYRFQYLGRDLAAYAMFEPETRRRDPPASIWGPIEGMVRAINDAPDPAFERDVSAYLDLAGFAAHIAVENFLADPDGILGYAGLNNFYLYRAEGGLLSRFLPWDKDNTFSSIRYPVFQGVAENVLARRLLALPPYRAIYLDTLVSAAARAGEPAAGAPGEHAPGPGWLEREILRCYHQVREAALTDRVKPATNEEFDAAVRALLDFAAQRGAFVRAEVAGARQPH